jgi:phosphate transport system substrate-binding protein
MRFNPSVCLRSALVVAGLCSGSLANALDISGSSTVQPVVEKLIPLYTQGGEAVTVAGGGSGAGVKNAIAGTSAIGMASRDLSDTEKAALKNAVIGIDALAIVVNQRNPVTSFTKSQLVELYTGKIDNWSALGGPDLPVQRVSKEVGRSTLELFEHYTGLLSPDRKKSDKPLIHARTYVVGANVEALTLVGGMPGAIGYVSVGTARAMAEAGMPVKIIPLDGQEPTDAAIKSGRYPIVRPLNLVFVDETPAVRAFLDLAQGPKGQEIVQSLGFLPVGATR